MLKKRKIIRDFSDLIKALNLLVLSVQKLEHK